MDFAASRVMNAFGLLSPFSASPTLFFSSLPLVQSQDPPKSISRKSFLLLSGIGHRFRTSGAKSRSRPLKVWPAFSIMLLPLIRSLLSPPSYFSLTGGLHRTFGRALFKLYRWLSIPIYFVFLVSTLAALLKPLVYWRLPSWNNEVSTAHLLKISASIDALSFIFEYLAGVYIQVYLITVCLAWIKGLSFREGALFAFAMRRFSYVLEWAGIVVVVSMLVLRLPMLLAYFINVPNVLDYLPLQRVFMSGFILAFCSVQISLVLHNETLREAFRAHRQLLRRDFRRLAWFCLICGLNFFLILVVDAMVRSAIVDRAAAMIVWKSIFVFLRALVTGWLLASWVVLFRQCESGRIAQENWIRY